jgi:hypothetical protein
MNSNSNPQQLQFLELDIPTLMSKRPPVWRHPHKQAIYERMLREGGNPQGTLRYTRWSLVPVAGEMPLHACVVETPAGFYRYAESGPGVWHVNFADPRLFAAYGSSLMAQDEWQALEHPVLGSLREALLYDEHPALTRQDGVSTPVLVMNAPRQCAIDLSGDSRGDGARQGWRSLLGRFTSKQRNLYGNAFRDARLDEVMAATKVLSPATHTNLIAISAPTGRGRYTLRQSRDILETAYAGFRAAVLESQRAGTEMADVVIYTGWWGCGAFGGHRVLMALLQILAARLAGVSKLVFHIGLDADFHPFGEVNALLEELVSGYQASVQTLLDQITDLGFSWGISDGN